MLAGAIVLLDFALAIFLPYPENTYFYSRENKGSWSQDNWAQDRELFWKPRDGFKSQKLKIKNSKEQKTIWIFGGSILTSHNTSTNFTKETQSCLGDQFRVINFGTGGYSSYQSMVLLRRMLNIGKPDIVVCCHGYNDQSLAPATDRQMALRNNRLSTRTMFYLRKSRLVSLWWKILENLFGIYEFTPEDRSEFVRREEPDQYESNLTAIMGEAKKKAIPLVFVSQASSDMALAKNIKPYFKIMERLAKQNTSVYFVDVRPNFQEVFDRISGGIPVTYSDKSHLLFVDLCHYNEQGHKIVGNKLCEFFQKQEVPR